MLAIELFEDHLVPPAREMLESKKEFVTQKDSEALLSSIETGK